MKKYSKPNRKALNSLGFTFEGGGTIPTPTSWGQWLKNQPAPRSKPGHKLDHLTIYTSGNFQEYDLSLDLNQRWGYALNVGYCNDYERTIADAKLPTPVTTSGKLLRLAIDDPAKYPVALATTQIWYRDEPYTQASKMLKEAYLRDAAGNVIGDWSPEATPLAMSISIEFKCAPLVAMQALGINVTNIYDGGERGLHITGDTPNASFGLDPRVVAARGSEDWVQYISRKKGEHLRLLYNRIKEIFPNRTNYVWYSACGSPFSAIPGARNYGYLYSEINNVHDLPSGSWYWRDTAISSAGMGNPSITDRAYFDVFTHWMEAVEEQEVQYHQTASYNFVSAGTLNGGNPAYFFLPIPSYKGFLKCMYATGQRGAVAGYFADDVDPRSANYPAFNPSTPPHWILQQMALGEVHARFTWLDEYILDGDLLPGVGSGKIKSYLPPYEFTANKKVGDFYAPIPDIRVLVRKRKQQDKWLVVLWAAEQGTPLTAVTTSPDKLAWVKDIPGLPPIEFTASGEGSIYTVVRTDGNLVITRMD